MPKKNKIQHPNVRRVVGASQFRRAASELRNDGFVPYNPGFCVPSVAPDLCGPEQTWGDLIRSELRSGSTETGSRQRRAVPSLYFSSGNENLSGADEIGTPGIGYIEWGFGNMLPNVVSLLTNLLPYTAAGVKFNSDMLAGLGPQPMYDVTQYIGGNISTKKIRYKDAGKYLLGKIGDKQRELANISKNYTEEIAPMSLSPLMEAEAETDTVSELKANLKKEIANLKSDYEAWEQTNAELQQFMDRNNLAHTWLALCLDQIMFNICFPELQLNQHEVDKEGKPVPTSQWKPKVVGLSHRPCHTTRLERMNNHGQINFVYCSNRWYDSPFIDASNPESLVVNALPALSPSAPLISLENKILDARAKNLPVEARPTRFVCPSVYPTVGRPYYPTPAWHSIFGGDIYEYLSTIISDRFNRKKNSNIIGRVIYLNHEYLQQLSMQKDREGNVQSIEKVRDEFYSSINTWLSNRNNAGQSLLAFTFQGRDGKEHKSFEVIEIESSNKSAADANEKETAEISSIVFMAMGLDARLLGSTPLSLIGSNSGTDIRERFLLRQILLSPTQNIMLKPLEVASRFNGWDPHLVWDIKREVMTTLDRSHSGTTEAEIM